MGTRWVDTNKGDGKSPKARCRIVAQELKTHTDFELFAATQLVECVTFLLACAASGQRKSRPSCLMIVGVKKAYFYAPSARLVYIELPPEDRGPGEEHLCRLPPQSLYGTCGAAVHWSLGYGRVLAKLGFVKGASSPCTF